MIPGEVLWNPKPVLRVWGQPYVNPAHVVTIKLLKLTAWVGSGWAFWQWVTISP